jgi:hypothetical protein
VVFPSLVSVIWVNWPFTGAESVIVVGTSLTGAWAQLGLQLLMSEVPVPLAPVAVHDDQLILVTMLVPSPL